MRTNEWTGRRTKGRTDLTKLLVAIRNFSSEPSKSIWLPFKSLCPELPIWFVLLPLQQVWVHFVLLRFPHFSVHIRFCVSISALITQQANHVTDAQYYISLLIYLDFHGSASFFNYLVNSTIFIIVCLHKSCINLLKYFPDFIFPYRKINSAKCYYKSA
jgi:hypothetical protein